MTTFYPGTIIPMASVPPPGGIPTAGSVYSGAVASMNNNIGTPVNTSPSFAMGQGTSSVNNINGGLAPTASFNSFSANPPQPSFNSFSSSPSNLTGVPQTTTSGFHPSFFQGSIPSMGGSFDQSGLSQPDFSEPPPTEGSFSGQSFTPTNSFVNNPFTGTSNEFGGPPSFSGSPPLSMGAMGGTNDPFPMASFGGTQVASIGDPSVGTNLLGGTPHVQTAAEIAQNPLVIPPRTNPYAPPFNDITGTPYNGPTGLGSLEMSVLAKPELGTNGAGFLSGQGLGTKEPTPYSLPADVNYGATIQPAPQDFGFGNSPPLPPTDPRSSMNSGASIQSNPYPGITGGIQPAPQDFGFGNPGNLPPLPPTVNNPNIPLPPTVNTNTPLPPTNPLGPFNAGMGSIQGAPQPTPFDSPQQPTPYTSGFFTPPSVTPPPFDFSAGSSGEQSAPTYNGQPMTNAQQFLAAQRAPMMQQLNNNPQQMTGLARLGGTEFDSSLGTPGQDAFMASRFNMANLGNQIDPSLGYNFFNHIPSQAPSGFNNEFATGPMFAGPDFGNTPIPGPYPGIGNYNTWTNGHPPHQELAAVPPYEMASQQQAIYDVGLGGLNPAMTPTNPLGAYATGNASGTVNRDPLTGQLEGTYVGPERYLMEGNTRSTAGAYFPPSAYAQQYSNAAQFVPGGLGPGAPTGGNFAAITSPGFPGFTTSQQPPIPYMQAPISSGFY